MATGITAAGDVRGGLAATATCLAAIAAASARRDYQKDDRLSIGTQLLMWPAYVAGGAAVAATAAEARSRGSRVSLTAGGVLTLAGTALFAAGARRFDSLKALAGRDTTGLITDGAYEYSRHPQYVANVLVCAGAAVAARSLAAASVAAGAAAAYAAYVPAEEAHLERIFGDEYRRYRARAPKWIGRPQGDPAP